MQALNRLVAKLPLDKAMLSFLTAAARIMMVIVLVTMVAGQLDVPITSLVALLSLFALAVSLSVQDVLANVVSGMVFCSPNRLLRAVSSARRRRRARWSASG